MKYRFRTRPYAHQRAALKFLLRHQWGGALLMEPRAGKTKTAIDWFSALNLQSKINRVLIVCPNRVMGVWLKEIMNECPRRVHVTVWDRKERRELKPPPTPPGYELYVVITNYETFGQPSRRKTKSGRPSKSSGRFKHRALLRKWMRGHTAACVLDESHKIKSPSGSAANMLATMRKDFRYRVILTGTPLTKAKRPHDIYMQWQFLNPERFGDLPTVDQFRERYGRWHRVESRGGGKFNKFLGPKNMQELHARMAADSFIIRREECFDLPPREDLVEYVDLRASRPAYDQMAEEMIAMLEDGSIAEAGLPVTQALRLGQITPGFVTDDLGQMKRIGYEKYDAMVEYVGSLLEQEQKVVVAARWKADLDIIEAFGQEMKVPTFAIRGKVKRIDSDRYIQEFASVDGAGLMIVQPAAAGLGIDLSTASIMVWFSHTPSYVDFTQCCDRIALSRSSTTFVHLVARHSVDEVVLATLAGDGDIHRAIMSHPGELLNGHPLNLDDHSRLQGIGSFQFQGRGK